MNDSLSIVVAVRNAEAALSKQVHHLLELLPELTGRFEILVVDDGSTDHTVELIRELAREFPQVRLIRHVQPRGLDASAKTGLRWAQGQIVFLQECPAAVSSTDIRRLWSLRHDRAHHSPPPAAVPGVFELDLLERLATWGHPLQSSAARGNSSGTIHMLRREEESLLAAERIAISTEKPAAELIRADWPHIPPAFRRHAATFLHHLRDLVTGE